MAEFKSGVVAAIASIKENFRGHEVNVLPGISGGAHVVIEDVPLGPPYKQTSTWVGFYLSDACPFDDTYPFYVTGNLERLDGKELKSPLHVNFTFPADGRTDGTRNAVMVSRRQRSSSSFEHESPLLKLKTVLKWMVQQ